jgi:hypothetical protein
MVFPKENLQCPGVPAIWLCDFGRTFTETFTKVSPLETNLPDEADQTRL